MPTSSQAMILRGNEQTQKTLFNLRFSSPVDFKPNCNKPVCTENVSGERVQFDLSVTASPDQSLQGYEGIFAYDPNSNSYQWQILPVNTKGRESRANTDSGDFEDSFQEEGTAVTGSGSFINRQTSDCTQHFTTPAESRMDNRENTRSHMYSPEIDTIDDATYRRLEELGFRRRSWNGPGKCSLRMRARHIPIRSPKGQVPEQQTTSNSVSTLTINNLDDETVPKPRSLPYRRNQFSPRGFITGNSLRKRVPVTKPKSLLDEVKESVNWSKRVMPTSHPRSLSALARRNVVCFSLREGHAFRHQDIKALIETQIQCKVQSLQYDAVSVRTGEAEVLDRWIVGLNTRANCERAVERGLSVNGDRVIVRAWDDIVREENMLSDSADTWQYPLNYRLQSEKHNRALKKFLQSN